MKVIARLPRPHQSQCTETVLGMLQLIGMSQPDILKQFVWNARMETKQCRGTDGALPRLKINVRLP
jgi:hypothetical protein